MEDSEMVIHAMIGIVDGAIDDQNAGNEVPAYVRLAIGKMCAVIICETWEELLVVLEQML